MRYIYKTGDTVKVVRIVKGEENELDSYIGKIGRIDHYPARLNNGTIKIIFKDGIRSEYFFTSELLKMSNLKKLKVL